MSGQAIENVSIRQLLPFNPSNGQVPVWNSTTKRWDAGNSGGSFDPTANYSPTGLWNFTQVPQVGGAALVTTSTAQSITAEKTFTQKIIANAGLEMAYQSAPTGVVGKTTFYADATGKNSWRNGTGFTRTFDASTITANRTWNLPDSDITFIGTNAAIDATLRSVIAGGTSALQVSTTQVGVAVNGAVATSTGSQKGSLDFVLNGSSWNGSAAISSAWTIKSSADLTQNDFPRIVGDYNGEQFIRVDKALVGTTYNSLGNTMLGYQAGKALASSGTGAYNNVFVGGHAGMNLTLGYQNTFIGSRCGVDTTTGYQNTFVGQGAGYYNTVGQRNVYVGFHAGLYNISPSGQAGSVIIGTQAGEGVLSSSTGYANVFIGEFAARLFTTAIQNTIIGTSAGLGLTTGIGNSYFGNGAGAGHTTGNYSTYFGFQAGGNNVATGTTGNTCMGYNAGNGAVSSSGNNNTLVGSNTAPSLTTGSENSTLGRNALNVLTTGNNNVSIGSASGLSLTTGSDNTMVGRWAGYTDVAANTLTTGSQNVFLGAQSGLGSTTQRSNAIAIGYRAKVDGDNTMILGNTSVSVGIGSTTVNISALFELTSTIKGFLAPRMTTAQKNAISTPATGLVLYDTDLATLGVYAGSWKSVLLESTAINVTQVNVGGTGITKPMIINSTSTMQVRLGNNSNFTFLQAKLQTHSAWQTLGAEALNGYLELYDSTGNVYKVATVA